MSQPLIHISLHGMVVWEHAQTVAKKVTTRLGVLIPLQLLHLSVQEVVQGKHRLFVSFNFFLLLCCQLLVMLNFGFFVVGRVFVFWSFSSFSNFSTFSSITRRRRIWLLFLACVLHISLKIILYLVLIGFSVSDIFIKYVNSFFVGIHVMSWICFRFTFKHGLGF